MGEKILLVGFACFDVCLLCKYYPSQEDTGHRVRKVIKRRGGNCSNSASALRQLGVPCHLFTSFGNDEEAEWMKKDLSDIGVILTNCPRVENATPVTYLILSEETGSRTTFLWKENHTEPTYEDFMKLDLSEYSWVHFEGRNEKEIKKMVHHVREWNQSREESRKLKISVEIEKEKPSMVELMPLGDVVIISKDFALFDGLKSMEEVIQKYKNSIRSGSISKTIKYLDDTTTIGYFVNSASIVVTWGELGAMAYLPDGTTFIQPSFPPKKIVDSVAAGDTFIAAYITALSRKQTIQEAVKFACRVAGAKVGIIGFDGLLKAIS